MKQVIKEEKIQMKMRRRKKNNMKVNRDEGRRNKIEIGDFCIRYEVKGNKLGAEDD